MTTKKLAELLAGPDRSVIENRFWSHVDKRGADDCWEWQLVRTPRGYGNITIARYSHRAHRVSFILAFGWNPPAVLHKCDNPPCVNPRHLFGGTQAENVADCIAKGRHARKITPAVRATILALAESGMPRKAIAAQVGVHWDSVGRVIRAAS